MAREQVADGDVRLEQLPVVRVVDPRVQRGPPKRLRLHKQATKLAGLEGAGAGDGREQSLVVQVTIAEIPAEHPASQPGSRRRV